jgi:hypothetical protein
MTIRRLFIITAGIFIISIFVCHTGLARTFYVKNAGNDSASGLSDATAWRTISKVNDYAETVGFSDNDIICFKRGDIFGDATLGYNGNFINWGTLNGLTIKDYGSGNKPKFNGDSVQPVGIRSSTLTNLTIQNLFVYGAATGDHWLQDAAILVMHVTNVTIDGIECDGRGGGSPADTRHMALSVHSCQGKAEIKNCTIYNWGPKNLPVYAEGTKCNALMIWHTVGLSGLTTISIHDNRVYNTNGDGLQMGYFNPANDPSRVCDISDNTFTNCGENSLDIKCSKRVNIFNNTFKRDNWKIGGWVCPGNLIVVHSSRSFPGAHCDEIRIFDNNFDGNFDGTHTLGGIAYSTGEIDKTYITDNTFTNVSPSIFIYSGSHEIKHNNFVANKPLAIESSLKCFIRQQASAVIDSNVFYATPDSTIETAIWQKNGTQSEYKNNDIYLNSSSTSAYAYPIYVNKGTGQLPTLYNNKIYNAKSPNRVYWDGIKYRVGDIAAYKNNVDGSGSFSAIEPFPLSPSAPQHLIKE